MRNFPTKLKKMYTTEWERSCRSKRLLIGYSKLRLSRWTSQLFRLGLFRIKCSLKSEQGNKRGPRLPEVDQTYVVKAKRHTQARSLIRHEAVIYFRFLNAFLITLLESLINIFLKLQIAPIYIYTYRFKISDGFDHRWRSYDSMKCELHGRRNCHRTATLGHVNAPSKSVCTARGHKPRGHNIT